jgi:hypothetical protein
LRGRILAKNYKHKEKKEIYIPFGFAVLPVLLEEHAHQFSLRFNACLSHSIPHVLIGCPLEYAAKQREETRRKDDTKKGQK